MYAEVIFYDDNGMKKNDQPYRIPAEKIHEHTTMDPYYEMIDYEFKFAWCERIPLDKREIEIHEREREAYEKGYEEGRESIERYYAGGRY